MNHERSEAHMKTTLKGKGNEVVIYPGGPVVVIGEKINPTGRRRFAAGIHEGNLEIVKRSALEQMAAGADLLDVNMGIPGMDEKEILPRAVEAVASVVDAPLCLDSANPEALFLALQVAPGKPLVNSVNGEEKSLHAILPVVKERGAAVIGLAMDEKGVPDDPETRVAIAGEILNRAVGIGIALDDVIIDPLVLTVGADHNAAAVTLRTIELLRREFGVNIILGASNVSFGLPERNTLNEAFLALAVAAGANCVITDPTKHGLTIKAIDLLMGRDEYGSRYIKHYRAVSTQS
jgi:5-methyltetrahydrofolate--homocysteine methyltransferase